MEKLSRPYQIALGALVVLALAWFTVLKPSDPEEAAPPPVATAAPGVAGLGAAVDQAEGAAAASAADGAALQAIAADPAGASPVPQPAAKGATGSGAGTSKKAGASSASPVDLSAPILRDVARGKVAVLLFYSRAAADDRAVRRALRAADRHRGRVTVRAARIARVADYAAITEGVDVLQSPTVLVIGEDKHAHTIVGFTDTKTIDQLVADVGGPEFAPGTSYGDRVRSVCSTIKLELMDIGAGRPEGATRFSMMRAGYVDVNRALERLDPPRRYASFHRLLERNYAFGLRGATAGLAAERDGRSGTAAYARATADWTALTTKVTNAARRVGLSRECS